MRHLRRLAWAAVVAVGSSTPALAQTVGGLTGGATGGTTGGTTGGVSGLGGSTGSLGGSTGGGAGGSSGQNTGTPLTQMQAAPSLTLSSTGATSPAVNASNVMGRWYANPYYLGIYTNNVNTKAQPGGFGTTLYQTSGTSAGRGGAGSAAGVRGGTGTLGDPGGVLVPIPRQIAYVARAQFPTPPAPAGQMAADLRGVIDRTPMIANPAGVQFVVDGRTVVLRGAVRDQEEARLVEGLVRLTPGVGAIRNELAYPQP